MSWHQNEKQLSDNHFKESQEKRDAGGLTVALIFGVRAYYQMYSFREN